MNDALKNTLETSLGTSLANVSNGQVELTPAALEECAECVTAAAQNKIALAVCAAGSYPLPAADAARLSIMNMNSIMELSAEDFLLVAAAGAKVTDVAKAADSQGFAVPLDIPYSPGATIGGAYMSGSFGLSAYRKRLFHDAVLGVRCVAADGSIITGGGRTAKNVTGYDIPRLLAGTLGIYAVAAELTIKITPKSPARKTLVCTFPSLLNAAAFCESISGTKDEPLFLEISRRAGKTTAVVTAAFEGFERIVTAKTERIGNLAAEYAAGNIETVDGPEISVPDPPIRYGPGFMTVMVPHAAFPVFVRRVLDLDSTLPLLAHPQENRLHCIVRDQATAVGIERISLSLGGKTPVSWETLMKKGIDAFMSEGESAIARKLKRELDPDEILNPHLLAIEKDTL